MKTTLYGRSRIFNVVESLWTDRFASEWTKMNLEENCISVSPSFIKNKEKCMLSFFPSLLPSSKNHNLSFCLTPFSSPSSRTEQTVYAKRDGLGERWMTVISFIRLLRSLLDYNLWQRAVIFETGDHWYFWFLIWLSPGMSEPILAVMRGRQKWGAVQDIVPSGWLACFINQLYGEWRHMSSARSAVE